MFQKITTTLRLAREAKEVLNNHMDKGIRLLEEGINSEEEEHIRKANVNVGGYLFYGARKAAIKYGLDTRKYDERMLEATKNLPYVPI